jgi:hypothetical protein
VDTQRFEVTIRIPAGAAAAEAGTIAAGRLRDIPGVAEVTLARQTEIEVTLLVAATEDRRAEVCRSLVEGGYGVVGLERSRKKLESVFLELVRGGDGASDYSHSAA